MLFCFFVFFGNFGVVIVYNESSKIMRLKPREALKLSVPIVQRAMEAGRKISRCCQCDQILGRSECALRRVEWDLVIGICAYGQRNQHRCFVYADLGAFAAPFEVVPMYRTGVPA